MRVRTAICARFAAAAMLAAAAHNADAQSMIPMRGEIRSFSDSFALRVYPQNPYRHRIQVAVRVYDEKFNPVAAVVQPSQMVLGGGMSRPVLVRVGFDGQPLRRVRVCTESVPFPNEKTRIKAQICGRFIAQRVK